MATDEALRCLRKTLDREWLENDEIMLRIYTVRHGRHNNAVDDFCIGFDLRTGNDEMTTCGGLPVVADKDFLDLVSLPHTFFIVMGENGIPSVRQYKK